MSGKVITAIAVVIIIVVGVVVGIILSDRNKPTLQVNNVDKNEAINIITQIDEEKQNFINSLDENSLEGKNENIQEEVTTITETFTETPKTEQEKAILMVKKDYGESSNIEFSIEGIDGKGRQIVAVRRADTTELIVFYFVDVANNTFDKGY